MRSTESTRVMDAATLMFLPATRWLRAVPVASMESPTRSFLPRSQASRMVSGRVEAADRKVTVAARWPVSGAAPSTK